MLKQLLSTNIAKVVLLTTHLCAILNAAPFTPDTIQSHLNFFRKYLSGLASHMSFPTAIIQSGMYLQGYTQEEVDAVPAAYPFLYKELYKRTLNIFGSQEFIKEVNVLLEAFERETAAIHCKKRRRQILHQIIHRNNIATFKLAQDTTTKQLARMVERRAIDIDLLCRKQLAAFFVKYYLDL